MSSAPIRPLPLLWRALSAVGWTAVLVVLAASGAGLVGQAWHAPGTPARAELTAPGDTALGARLDVASAQLSRIAEDVERLATEAKIALSEIASSDPTRLRDALTRGAQAATTIDADLAQLRTSLADLPGDEPTAVLEYSNATLVRRSAILAAMEAASGLSAQWAQVAGQANAAIGLTSLISRHDATVLAAATSGRERKYGQAVTVLDDAILTVAAVQEQRVRLIAGSEPTVLDEWIQRNSEYDLALQNLYRALVASHGNPSAVEVQSARREERAAFERLPPDARTIVIIVSEVTRGGLVQAVVAIEDARGHIDEALEEAEQTPRPT